MLNDVQKRRRSEAGAALVELAVALPLLMLVLVGTIDFARVFYMAIELTNAARAGAQEGAHNTGFNQSASQAAAIAAAPNISSVSALASRLCQCADDAGSFFSTSPANTCTATSCPSGHLVISITVTASRTFTTIATFPGVPSTIPLSRSATLRVAN